MQALHDVIKLGWVRYIGMSSCYAWQFHAMQSVCWCCRTSQILITFIADYALNNGLTPFISMQNHHSLLYREEEREMNALCKVWSFAAFSLLNQTNSHSSFTSSINLTSRLFGFLISLAPWSGHDPVVAACQGKTHATEHR